jgi:hypothetical protein
MDKWRSGTHRTPGNAILQVKVTRIPTAKSHVIHKWKISQSDTFWDRTKAYFMGPVRERGPRIALESAKYRKNSIGFAGKKYYP